MSANELKALYRQYIEEVWNGHDLAAMGRYFTPDTRTHALPPGSDPGLAGIRENFAMFFAAFPDVHLTIEDQIAEGDKVVTRLTLRGTHRGPFFGIPPSGRRVTTTSVHILRYVDGRMAEHWSNSDDLGMLQQLGVLPAPGPARGAAARSA